MIHANAADMRFQIHTQYLRGLVILSFFKFWLFHQQLNYDSYTTSLEIQMDERDPGDATPYLLAIWMPGKPQLTGKILWRIQKMIVSMTLMIRQWLSKEKKLFFFFQILEIKPSDFTYTRYYLSKLFPMLPSPFNIFLLQLGETENSTQPPKSVCNFQGTGKLCNDDTCFQCNSVRETNSQIVRGTLLVRK